MTEPNPAAGWFPDPVDPAQLQWWDGTAWTEHRQPAPGAAPALQVQQQAAAAQQPVHQQAHATNAFDGLAEAPAAAAAPGSRNEQLQALMARMVPLPIVVGIVLVAMIAMFFLGKSMGGGSAAATTDTTTPAAATGTATTPASTGGAAAGTAPATPPPAGTPIPTKAKTGGAKKTTPTPAAAKG